MAFLPFRLIHRNNKNHYVRSLYVKRSIGISISLRPPEHPWIKKTNILRHGSMKEEVKSIRLLLTTMEINV